jgi:hypothetical protein
MVWRCKQTSGHCYKYYGSRGITVCERWLEYDNFLKDMGIRPEGMTLERIDNNRGYEPSNCRWATWKEQAQNRGNSRLITVDGETLTISEWARRVNRSQATVHAWWKLSEAHFIKRVKSLQGKSTG